MNNIEQNCSPTEGVEKKNEVQKGAADPETLPIYWYSFRERNSVSLFGSKSLSR